MKNYHSLVPVTEYEPARTLPAMNAVRFGAAAVITIVALVVFGPFWIVEGVRRRFGKGH